MTTETTAQTSADSAPPPLSTLPRQLIAAAPTHEPRADRTGLLAGLTRHVLQSGPGDLSQIG